MSDPAHPASTERVSTSGAWLGLGLAVRAALCVVSGVSGFLLMGFVTLVLDQIGKAPEAGDLPPEVGSMLQVLSELTTIFRPYSLVAGGAAIGIGLLMFVASAGLVAGSELGRRAARALLVADMLHSVAATVWLVALWLGPLGDWNARLLRSAADLGEAASGSDVPIPAGLQTSTFVNLLSVGVSLAFSLAIAGVLCWLAGRPFARNWCAARSGGTAIATRWGPR